MLKKYMFACVPRVETALGFYLLKWVSLLRADKILKKGKKRREEKSREEVERKKKLPIPGASCELRVCI